MFPKKRKKRRGKKWKRGKDGKKKKWKQGRDGRLKKKKKRGKKRKQGKDGKSKKKRKRRKADSDLSEPDASGSEEDSSPKPSRVKEWKRRLIRRKKKGKKRQNMEMTLGKKCPLQLRSSRRAGVWGQGC